MLAPDNCTYREDKQKHIRNSGMSSEEHGENDQVLTWRRTRSDPQQFGLWVHTLALLLPPGKLPLSWRNRVGLLGLLGALFCRGGRVSKPSDDGASIQVRDVVGPSWGVTHTR